MPRRFTMADLRARALQQVDLDADGALADPLVVNAMMSGVYGSLYSVVAKTGLRYFEYSTTLVTTGLAYVAEPADHLATTDTLERIVDPVSGRLRRVKPLAAQERAFWAGRSGHARRYELVDDRVNFYPTPPVGDQYILRYIPQPPDLKNYGDADVVDVVSPEGEEYFLWGCGLRFLAKMRSDVTLAMSERDRAKEELSEWASLRAFNEPPQTYVEDDDDDFYRDGDWRFDR